MAFNWEAGLAAMGETVGKFAGVAALEMQKAELQRESMTLANQLATERESRGRAESHGYDMEKTDKVQTFTAGENEKSRAADLQRTNISAGASIAVANIGLKGRQMEIDALAPVRQAQIEAHKAEVAGRTLDNDLKINQATARKELQAATEGGDPAAIEAAKAKVAIYDDGAALRAAQARALGTETDAKALELKAKTLVADTKQELLKEKDPAKIAELKRTISIIESSTKEDRAEIALWQQQAKLAETAMTATMTRLTTLTKDRYGAVAPEDAVLEQTLQRILKQQEAEFKAATRQARALLDSLDPARKAGGGEATDLTKYLKGVNPPAGTPAKPKAFPQPPGLIDTPMPGVP